MNKYILSMLLLLGSSGVVAETKESTVKVTPFEEVKWGYLNPLRGDKSPGAANLWGSRTTVGATGMLVRFNKGFSSPPHIHNVSYRGIVIKGLLHNDDPSAEKMWLTPGSFWTQPAGEAHITAAQGEYNLAYVEIDSGPYLVNPVNQAFNNGEKPVNIDQTNLAWIDSSELTWLEFEESKDKSGKAEAVYLWGSRQNNELNGMMVKLPEHFKGKIVSESDTLIAVVIQGTLDHERSKQLRPGSYFESQGKSTHNISTKAGEVIMYLRSNGAFSVLSQ